MVWNLQSNEEGNKMRKFAVLALLLGLLAGCGAVKAETALPEEMPADFEIRYENWIDEKSPNIYDTGEKLLQKDLVDPDGQRTAQAELNVSGETRQEIYAKVRVCALDRLTKAIHTTDETEASMTPLRRYKVTFIADGETYAITGDTMVREYAKTNGRAAQFWEFVQYMEELYLNSPEYLSLPEAQGGYL